MWIRALVVDTLLAVTNRHSTRTTGHTHIVGLEVLTHLKKNPNVRCKKRLDVAISLTRRKTEVPCYSRRGTIDIDTPADRTHQT